MSELANTMRLGLARGARGLLLATVVVGALLMVSAAGTWKRVGTLRGDGSRVQYATEKIPLDYFMEEESFSEVENAKSLVKALAGQALAEIRSRQAAAKGNSEEFSAVGLESGAATQSLREIEKRLQEFRGTEEEFLLTREQLFQLHKSGQHERWLAVYLSVLYEHPTQELVGREARRAYQVAKQAGRQDEMLAAFSHLCRIPFEFSSKTEVRDLLRAQDEIASHTGCEIGGDDVL